MPQINRSLSLTAALLGLVAVSAAACGGGSDDNRSESNVGASSSTGGSTGSGGPLGQGGDDTGIHLNVGGESTGGSGLGDGGNCGATLITANPPVVNVLLVVDKSLSMNDTPSGFSKDKWDAMQDALAATFQQTAGKILYGLDLFPYSGVTGQALSDTCEMPTGDKVVVPIQAGTKAAPLILKALADNPPSGGTPTAAALTRARDYFSSGAGKGLDGERYVLLATDGGPNCNADLTCDAASCTVNMDGKCPGNINCCDAKLDPLGPYSCLDDAESLAAVKALAKIGVKTIVVGIPGTEAYSATLDKLAGASGVPNPNAPPDYFAVSAKSGVAGLSSMLGTITSGLVKSCELHLEESPPDVHQLFVVVDGVELVAGDPDGWRIQDPQASPPVIEITGAACRHLETEGAEYINVTYGCPQYEPPVK